MLHRLAATFIVTFWLVMTGLLVFQQMHPEATNLNAVPVAYVGRMIFQHQQSSDLEIYDKDKDVGYLHLQPRVVEETGVRALELDGNLSFTPPDGGRQRVAWHGNIQFDAAFGMKSLHLSISTLAPVQQLVLDINTAAKTARYVVKAGNAPIEENTLTLDERGFSTLLEQAGISPALLAQFSGGGVAQFSPVYSAQQSTMLLNGETASTFLLSMKVGDQPIIEAHVSQLGQVLKAGSPLFGYRLLPHSTTP